ncbi:MAG: tetratricopeptide repeat protein [Deltaproteobacteria bacterium]|nr:tetratricopeptide repeat protein [Deltaproteobacteria bacterium]
MKIPLRCLIAGLLCLVGTVFPRETGAANKVYDYRLLKEKGVARFVLLLEESPKYSLKPARGGALKLTLADARIETRLSRVPGTHPGDVKIEEEKKNPSGLTFHIRLGGPARLVETSWLPKEKLLLLTAKLGGAGDWPAKPVKTVLKRLRFGIQKEYSRMVADLGKRPMWEWDRRAANRAVLRIPKGLTRLRRKEFTGIDRIGDVRVKRAPGGVDIDLVFTGTDGDHARIFWLDAGKKLVADFFDRPLALTDERLRLKRKEREDVKIAKKESQPSKDPALEKGKAGEDIRGPLASENLSAGTERKEMPPVPSSAPGGGPVVRKKIHRPGQSPGSGTTVAAIPPPVIHPVDIIIEPDIDLDHMDRIYNPEWVHHLNSEEAFLVGRIQEAWETKAYEKGAKLMEDFLSRFPESPLRESLSFLIGDFRLALLKEGRKEVFPLVIKSYSEAVRRFPQSGRVGRTYVRMAQAEAFMGRNYDALASLDMAIGRYPEGSHLPLAYLTRGKVYLRLNQPEKAVRDLKVVLSRFPHSSVVEEAHYEIAKYLYSVGAYKEAKKRFSELLEKDPDFYLKFPGFLSFMAQTSLYLKDYETARNYYFKALNLGHQPESEDLLLAHIGDTYNQQSREREAEKFYRLAIELDPESEGASIARLRLADYASGVTLFKEVHQKNLNNTIGDLALLNMAKRLYEQRQYQMAMDTLKKLMEKPKNPDIQEKARDLYASAVEEELKKRYKSGEYDKVVAMRESGILPRPSKLDPEVYLMVAQSYYHLEKYGEAIQVFRAVKPYDLSLTSKGAYFMQLADCYEREGDLLRAEKVLEQGRREGLATADKQRITLKLADLLKENADFRRAYGLYESVVKDKRVLSDLEIARAYLAMGQISNLEQRYERARASLNRCIALAEKDRKDLGLLQSAYVEMGNGYHREGNDAMAIKAYRRGLDLGYGPEKKDYWKINYRLALSYLNTGKTREAEEIFNAIAEEGDPLLQQKVQIKMGMMDLEKQLKRLPIPRDREEETL